MRGRMIHPPEDQKRKPSEPSEGTPDDPASSSTPPSDPPASATSDKLGIEMSQGSLPIAIEQLPKVLADTALYFTSIGWLVQLDGRGISIEQGQNLSGQEK
jgi:hypothetical protein